MLSTANKVDSDQTALGVLTLYCLIRHVDLYSACCGQIQKMDIFSRNLTFHANYL